MATNPTPAPDAGHAAETMSNEDLIYRFAQACARNSLANRDIYERLKAELLCRLNHTAPARTGEGGR